MTTNLNVVRRDLYRSEIHELRVQPQGDGGATITGYAAVFGHLSEDLGGWRERIKVGAFTRTLREGADVRALVDHDPSKILGRNLAGTLRLTPNAKGLFAEIDAPETQLARDLRQSIKRGDVSGMSFAFSLRRDQNGRALDIELHEEDGVLIREVLDVGTLRDVSIVTYPAYPQTDVAARSLWGIEEVEREIAAFREQQAQEELRRRQLAGMREELAKRGITG